MHTNAVTNPLLHESNWCVCVPKFLIKLSQTPLLYPLRIYDWFCFVSQHIVYETVHYMSNIGFPMWMIKAINDKGNPTFCQVYLMCCCFYINTTVRWLWIPCSCEKNDNRLHFFLLLGPHCWCTTIGNNLNYHSPDNS